MKFEFHRDAVPATGLKVELVSGKAVVKDKRGLVLSFRITNGSAQEIKTSLAHEWHGGLWPPTSLFASVAHEGGKDRPAFAPVYLAGENPGMPRAVMLGAGKSVDVELRMDWPGTGSVPAEPFINRPGKYAARFALVFEAGGMRQYALSAPVVVEYKAG
jgi:hypothetical protein